MTQRRLPPLTGTKCKLCQDGWARWSSDLDAIAVHILPDHQEFACIASTDRDRLEDMMYMAQAIDEDSLTRVDLLHGLIDDCAEIIHAAAKCIRFGYDRNWPGYGVNHEKLAEKVCDQLAILQLLRMGNTVNADERIRRMAVYKQYMRKVPETAPQIPLNTEIEHERKTATEVNRAVRLDRPK